MGLETNEDSLAHENDSISLSSQLNGEEITLSSDVCDLNEQKVTIDIIEEGRQEKNVVNNNKDEFPDSRCLSLGRQFSSSCTSISSTNTVPTYSSNNSENNLEVSSFTSTLEDKHSENLLCNVNDGSTLGIQPKNIIKSREDIWMIGASYSSVERGSVFSSNG